MLRRAITALGRVPSSTLARGSPYQLKKARLYSTEFYNNISSADKSLADEVVSCLSLMREGGDEEGRYRINVEISSVLEKIISRPSLKHCIPLLIDEWLLHDLEMTASLYVLLVNYYLQEGNCSQALAVVESGQWTYYPSAAVLKALLTQSLKEGSILTVFPHLISMGFRPSPKVVEQVLLLYCRESLTSPPRPTPTHRIVNGRRVRTKSDSREGKRRNEINQANSAYYLFDYYKFSLSIDSEGIHTRFINTLLKLDLPQLAMNVLAHSRLVGKVYDISIYNKILRCCAESGDVEGCRTILEYIAQGGYTGDDFVFSEALLCYGRRGAIGECIAALNVISSRGYYVTEFAFESLLFHAIRSPQAAQYTKSLIRLLETRSSPKVNIQNVYKRLILSSQSDVASTFIFSTPFVGHLRSRGLHIETVTALVKAAQTPDQFMQIYHLLKYPIQGLHSFMSDIHDTIVARSLERGCYAESVALHHLLVGMGSQPYPATLTAMFHSCTAQQDTVNACKLYRFMVDKGVVERYEKGRITELIGFTTTAEGLDHVRSLINNAKSPERPYSELMEGEDVHLNHLIMQKSLLIDFDKLVTGRGEDGLTGRIDHACRVYLQLLQGGMAFDLKMVLDVISSADSAADCANISKMIMVCKGNKSVKLSTLDHAAVMKSIGSKLSRLSVEKKKSMYNIGKVASPDGLGNVAIEPNVDTSSATLPVVVNSKGYRHSAGNTHRCGDSGGDESSDDMIISQGGAYF